MECLVLTEVGVIDSDGLKRSTVESLARPAAHGAAFVGIALQLHPVIAAVAMMFCRPLFQNTVFS